MEERKKNEVTFQMLEFLEVGTRSIGALANVFFADRATSYRRLRNMRLSFATPLTDSLRQYIRERHNFASLLHRLKRDGFLAEIDKRAGQVRITARGKDALNRLRLSPAFSLKKYRKESSREITLVSFDIPERERKKRAWLRQVLRQLGFEMIQRSVWLGKAKIPLEFIEDLRKEKLLPHVEIVGINRQGSLRIESEIYTGN